MPLGRAHIADRLAKYDVQQIADHPGRRAAVTVAVLSVDGVQGIWLTRRTPTLRAHAGQFALPGGRIDPGETAAEAAIRETHEEMGYAAEPSDVLGFLDDYETRSGYVITPVVVWIGADPAYEPNPAEVARVFHISFAELDVEPIFQSIPESPRPVIQLPLIGHRIHAPTAAVMYQFREVVLRERPTRVNDLEQPVFAWK